VGDHVTAPLVVLLLGSVLLAVVTVRAVPAQSVPAVTAADVDRDFTRAEQDRERAFRRRVRPWGLAATALDVLVPTVLVLSGAVTAVVRATPGPWWLGVVTATTSVLVVTRLATIPGAVVVRRRSLEVGLAAGSWSRWLRDLVVAFGLGWLLTCLALVGWVAAARVWPESWWVVLAPVAAGVVIGLSFLVPVVIEPLFARVTPMPEGPLRRDLLELAARDGVAVRDVLVADASRRTTALNAYVSGLGSTRRVVVHDTLLDRGRDDEVRAVVAHELGHVVAHDVRTGTVLGAAGAALAVVAAAVALSWSAVLALGHVTSVTDPAVVGLLLVGGAWAGLLSAPLQSAVSRRVECRADQHCLDLAAAPAPVASMHRALAVTNLGSLRPPRVLHLWFGTHPTSPQRIAAVRAWAAAHGGPDIDDLAPTDAAST
jgi:STE24 endopeptidase